MKIRYFDDYGPSKNAKIKTTSGQSPTGFYGRYGTGRGHGTDRAVFSGLADTHPETVDPDAIEPRALAVIKTGQLELLNRKSVPFDAARDLVFDKRTRLPLHSNGMRFTAFSAGERVLRESIYYSVGGGFLIDQSEGEAVLAEDDTELPFTICSGDELLRVGREHGLSLSEIMMQNECVWRPERDVRKGLLHIWHVMRECVETGCRRMTTHPPGSLRVVRRAPGMFATLTDSSGGDDPHASSGTETARISCHWTRSSVPCIKQVGI